MDTHHDRFEMTGRSDRAILDDLDHRLIALLRADARLPVSSLAATLGVSRATVRAHIDRLLQRGIIRGFTVVLSTDVPRTAIRAIMMVEVEGRAADRVARQLLGYPEVRSLHTTNGRWDIVTELETEHLAAFDEVLRRIRLIEGITSTETSILLASRRVGGRVGA